MATRVQVGPAGSLDPGSAQGQWMGGPPGHLPAPPLARLQSAEKPVILSADAGLMRKIQALEDLAPDSPAVRGAINALSVVVDLFKLSMACMLVVFVPQSCPGNEEATGGSGNCTDVLGAHECSFSENFRCLSPINQFALGWNFICLLLFYFHYALLWKREKFMLYYFEETLQYGRLNLRQQMGDEYPTVSIWLHRYNRWLFNISVVVTLFQVVNVGVSGKLCFLDYPNGYKTFTTFVTCTMLIVIVMYQCLTASYTGLRHKLAYSAIVFEPVSYNSIQPHNIKGQ